MIAYSLILFAVAAVLTVIGIRIYRGKTDLIHDYHRAKIKESQIKEYGKSFSKAVFGISSTLTASGIFALFGETKAVFIASISVLFIGMTISFIAIGRVQKKYNGGLF